MTDRDDFVTGFVTRHHHKIIKALVDRCEGVVELSADELDMIEQAELFLRVSPEDQGPQVLTLEVRYKGHRRGSA